jgi:metal-responsive CopG/Arc/MetJ family transcriptional regulator
MAKRKPKPAPEPVPAAALGTVVGVRFPDDLLAHLDAWIAQQPGGVTRPGAIRWIVARWLNENAREQAA